MVQKLLGAAAVVVMAIGLMAGTAHGSPPPNHNHFLTVPGNGNVVQVGPHVCADPEHLHHAFHKFHSHVHVGTPTSQGGLSISASLCA